LPDFEVEPIEIDDPLQIAVSGITDITGKELTVMTTELDFTHPFILVSVKVYEAVEIGETEGFENVELYPETELAQE